MSPAQQGLTIAVNPRSTPSIVEKLRRESIRLTQMQDIAGCRVVVYDTLEQDRVSAKLTEAFPGALVVDRRVKPSHGYRAVHVIVSIDEKPVEIQVRTEVQHKWAQMCEQFADEVDPAIKYGGGDQVIGKYLASSSSIAARIESLEPQLATMTDAADRAQLERGFQSLRDGLTTKLADMMKVIADFRGLKE